MEKIACVVGAAGGFGSCFARVCLEHGYRVFGGDRMASARSKELADQFGDRFLFQEVDIGNAENVGSFAGWIREQADHIDILMNAAGLHTENTNRLFEDVDLEMAPEMFNINALGPLRIIQQLISLVIASEDKLALCISSEAASMSAPVTLPYRYDYGMSKAALNLAVTILQRYYKSQGVKFMLYHPGWMRTEMGGPNALVDPAESARSIFEYSFFAKKDLDAHNFCDYNGTPRPW